MSFSYKCRVLVCALSLVSSANSIPGFLDRQLQPGALTSVACMQLGEIVGKLGRSIVRKSKMALSCSTGGLG